MVDIVVQVIPMVWKTELVREKYYPVQLTLDDLEGRLVMLEVGETLSKSSLKSLKKGSGESADKTSVTSSSKSGKTEKKDRSRFNKGKIHDKPPCQLCTILGGNSDSHSTKNCYKKAASHGYETKAVSPKWLYLRFTTTKTKLKCLII